MLRNIFFTALCVPAFAIAENLAFLGYTDGYWQVFVMDTKAKTDAKQLSFSPFNKTSLNWLADGNTLFVSGLRGRAEIHSLVANSVKPMQLPLDNINDAVMSPDGKHIAYTADMKAVLGRQLWLYDVRAKQAQPVYGRAGIWPQDPVWNASGDKIYYLRTDRPDHYDIASIGVNNKRDETVLANGARNLDLSVSGNRLYFSTDHTGDYDIWYSQKGQLKQYRVSPGLDMDPVWSDKSNGLYFVRYAGGVSNIWFQPGDNTSAKAVTQFVSGARKPVVIPR